MKVDYNLPLASSDISIGEISYSALIRVGTDRYLVEWVIQGTTPMQAYEKWVIANSFQGLNPKLLLIDTVDKVSENAKHYSFFDRFSYLYNAAREMPSLYIDWQVEASVLLDGPYQREMTEEEVKTLKLMALEPESFYEMRVRTFKTIVFNVRALDQKRALDKAKTSVKDAYIREYYTRYSGYSIENIDLKPLE